MQQKQKNVINPSEDARKVDLMAWRAETLFIGVTIMSTSVAAFFFGKKIAQDMGAPEWIAFIVGVVAAAISGYVTDYAFRHLLQEVIFQPLSWMHPGCPKKKQSLFFWIMGGIRQLILTLIVVLLFWGDWYGVQALREPFSDQAKKKPTTDVNVFASDLGSSLSAATSPMAAQITQIKSDIKAAEERVEAGNPGLVVLKKEGNDWAVKELSKKTKAATKELREELSSISKGYNEALSATSKTLTAETQRITNNNNLTDDENKAQKATLSNLYFYMGVGSKVLSVLFRIFLVVSFLYKNPTLDANGDGVVDGKDVTAAARGEGFRTALT